MTLAPPHLIDDGTDAQDPCPPPNDKNSAVLALDEISALCGDSADWEYPGQVVRSVELAQSRWISALHDSMAQLRAIERRVEGLRYRAEALGTQVRNGRRDARMMAFYLCAFAVLYVGVLVALGPPPPLPSPSALLLVTVGWLPPLDAIRRAVRIVRGPLDV